MPRFRIARFMVFIALMALDLRAVRELSQFRGNVRLFLILGTLPMANVLVVSILIGQRRPGSRPFLLGFEAFGAVALALYVALVSLFPNETVFPCFQRFYMPIMQAIGHGRLVVLIPLEYLVAPVLLSLPQVVFALIGGSVSGKFRITKRPDRTPC
jgi:hypothetical protein